MMIEVLALKLPEKVRGAVGRTGDEMTILVNAADDSEIWPATIRHELQHIVRGDLDGGDVQEIEIRREAEQYDTAEAVAMLKSCGRASIEIK